MSSERGGHASVHVHHQGGGGFRVRIAGEGGARLEAGGVGEVLIRMPGRQREYYRDAEATEQTWSGGWLHTGDLGRLDEDGYLYIVGRKKEVIIRGGNLGGSRIAKD